MVNRDSDLWLCMFICFSKSEFSGRKKNPRLACQNIQEEQKTMNFSSINQNLWIQTGLNVLLHNIVVSILIHFENSLPMLLFSISSTVCFTTVLSSQAYLFVSSRYYK